MVAMIATERPWLMRTLRGWLARVRRRVVRTKTVELDKIVYVDVPGPALKEVPVLIRETTVKIVPIRGVEGEVQPFTTVDKITGPEAEAKLRVIKGDQS